MFKLPLSVRSDINKYKESLEKYLKGGLTGAFFKGIRVPWGNYSQRGDKYLMSRLRIPAGIITPVQLRAIADSAKDFAGGRLHITTRQDIQIHDVPYANSLKIMESLKNLDISPRGGGGNTIRNITACSMSGVCMNEKIEVYKLAWGLSEYLLAFEDSFTLPRKIKIAFSGCGNDCAFAGVNDIGILATAGGLKVLCGGGMGARSMVGRVLEENVKENEIGYIIRAIVNIFNKHGDRKDRRRNRLRYFIQNTGWETFVEMYRKELGSVNKEQNEITEYCVKEQKQKGYFSVKIKIPCGELLSGQLIGLSGILDGYQGAVLRVTQSQNFIISNIPGSKVLELYGKVSSLLGDTDFPETLYDVVSCKAATTCNLGICNAIAVAPVIVKELKKLKLSSEVIKELRININGCPNACGQHPIGILSFSGQAKKVYERMVPFYKVFMGGKTGGENTRLASEIGLVPARILPEVISEFVQEIENRKSKDIRGLINKEGTIIMKALMEKYSFIPAYEENRLYYVDFGKTEDFSLAGIGQAECGAGVIDMIEADIGSAKLAIKRAEKEGYAEALSGEAIAFSARALLVVKGLEPKDTLSAINMFTDNFIKTGICDPKYSNLKDMYSKILLLQIDEKQAFSFAESFCEEVGNIYALMDSNFNFAVKEEKKAAGERPASVLLYDLRGSPCPINYVKAKLKLEGLALGDLLELYLDEGAPIKNVPGSLKLDGQEIIKTEKSGDFYKVTVKRMK